MTDDSGRDRRRKPPPSRRRGSTARTPRSTDGPRIPRSTDGARNLRARLDAIPDLDDAPGGRVGTGDRPARPARPKRPGRPRPEGLSRDARASRLEEPPTAETPADDVWDMPERSTLHPVTVVEPHPDEDDLGDDAFPHDDGVRSDEDRVEDTSPDVARVRPRERSRTVHRAPPLYRRIAFGMAIIVLLAAIPLLGREGYRLVTRSKAGQDATVNLSRTDPNYVEQVESTPTAVIAQTDGEGALVGLTVLSRTSESGGAVLFVPIDTELENPRVLAKTIERAFELQNQALPGLESLVSEVLNVAVDRVEGFDSRTFEHWIEPVGSLTFTNPDDLVLPDGTHVAPGEVELRADQVGDYLAHLGEDEDQLSQYLRHQRVWEAWLDAIREDPEALVPGDQSDPLAPFIRHLGSVTTRLETVPGAYEEGVFVPDADAFGELIVDAIPAPRSPDPSTRARVRLLNGVAPELPPAQITRRLVALDTSIVVVGNGPDFDQTETEVLYSDEDLRGRAEEILGVLGSTAGTVRENPGQVDEVEFTVILGRDVFDRETTGD